MLNMFGFSERDFTDKLNAIKVLGLMGGKVTHDIQNKSVSQVHSSLRTGAGYRTALPVCHPNCESGRIEEA